jgi:hypothetical protein
MGFYVVVTTFYLNDIINYLSYKLHLQTTSTSTTTSTSNWRRSRSLLRPARRPILLVAA